MIAILVYNLQVKRKSVYENKKDNKDKKGQKGQHLLKRTVSKKEGLSFLKKDVW